MHTLRSALNAAGTLPWTAMMTSYGVARAVASRDTGVFRRLERVWAKGLISGWGLDVAVSGGDPVLGQTPHIVICNHQSYVDIPILFLTLPTVPGFVAKQELSKIPFLAAALRAGGHVLIDRSSRKQAIASLQRAAEEIRAGKTVAIFPEGTRSPSGSIGRFKSGGFHLAKQARVPILPVGIRGTREVLPKDAVLVQPGSVEVVIGTPIPAQTVAELPVAELSALTRRRVAELSGRELAEA